MGALQKLIAQILSRLRDINTSQRVALLLGGALVAVSLIWLIQWAASPDMVSLLPQDLQPDELALVRGGLEASGEPFEVRGSRVFVRAAANRTALLAQLQQQEKLPANTSAGFAGLVKETNHWISQAENDRRWTYALQKEVEEVLRQFNGVRDARVFLNLTTARRGFTRETPAGSASVTLVMRHGEEVTRPLALAAARLVSGAVAGLSPRNVQVLDASGRSALDWGSEDDAASEVNRQRVKHEQYLAEKIRGQVPDPKALVSVQVELELTKRNSVTETPIAGQAVSEKTETEKTVRLRRSEQPGVQMNVGVVAGGSGGADETHETDTISTELSSGRSRKTEDTPAGDIKKVTAAISLSSSYLEGVFRRLNPDVKSPTDAQLEELFQREKTRLASQVMQLVKPQVEENVAIARYYDTAAEPAAGSPGRGMDDALDLMRRYGAQSGLGLLALLSLGLMLRMAKKTDVSDAFGLELGLPQEAIEAAKKAAEDVSAVAVKARARGGFGPRSSGGGGGGAGQPERILDTEMLTPIGQAAVTEGMLVAQEVDPATVQTRKMLDQVTQMVDSDAATVSSLVEQWVQRSEQYREGGG